MDIWCLFCHSGQCVHIGSGQISSHGAEAPVPYAITIHGGDAYCADCIAGYVRITKDRMQSGELTGMRLLA